MKSIIIFTLAMLFSLNSSAGNITGAGTYKGKIKGVGVGFWGHIGVGLDGIKCNGRDEVLLLSTNANHKEIYSLLLAAEASGKLVIFYKVAGVIEQVDPNYSYCVIRSAALGDFPQWQ
jgi:hypothetical protein